MTLATTCPVCKTSFKVIPDQLKLRRGLVRCGSCHNVFSGIDHLRQVNDEFGQPPDQAPGQQAPESEPSLASAVPTAKPAAEPTPFGERPQEPAHPIAAAWSAESQSGSLADLSPEEFDRDEAEDLAEAISELIAESESGRSDEIISDPGAGSASGQNDEPVIAQDAADEAGQNVDAFLEPRAEGEPGQSADAFPELITASELEQRDSAFSELIAELQPEPREPYPEVVSGEREAPDAGEMAPENPADAQPEEAAAAPLELAIPASMRLPQEDAIDFFSESAQRRIRWWPRSALGKMFAILLLAALTAQLALGLRSEIVARYPPARAALEALAQPLGLKVDLPRNPRKITIEIDLSIGDAPGMYRMNALLRSHSETALQWPAIEISLTDANGATAVRRVLMPSDYLADQATIVAGLPGRSEQNLRVDFLLRDVVLTGYSAVLFYP